MKKLDKLPLSSVGSKMYGLEVMHLDEICLFVTFATISCRLGERYLWLEGVVNGKLKTL
jgi:hypothetical protein